MRTAEEILYLWRQRKDRLSPMHQAALEVRAAYYGDITLPLPELDRNEKPLVANFILSAGEQKAQRVSSTMPDLYYPSSDPGAPRADSKSRQRRLVNLAWWDEDVMRLKMAKRARHMVYYAHTPVMIRPKFSEHRPTWQIRNPLTTLAPEMDVGDVVPEDIIFTYAKSYAWLMNHYPSKVREFGLAKDVQDGVFSVLEYQDADDTVMLAVGEKVEAARGMYQQPTRQEMIVELDRQPNRVGRCTATVAGGIGLEHPRGGFDGTIGMWQALGKIMALEAIGMQRSIWPEEWLIDDQTGDGAKIVTQADPLHGVVGHVTGGQLKEILPQINQMGTNLMDRFERGIRLEAGIPAELGGESGSNIRTGKRGDQILSAVMDFPLKEMQDILAVALREENKLAIAVDKAYFPTRKSIYISATAGTVEYEAEQFWDNDTHFVRYSHAGVDAQGIVVELGQLVGTGLISKRSAMETHPLIEDAQGEFDRITQEHVRDGLLQGLAAMAEDLTSAPVVAQVMQKLKQSEVEVEDAVLAVHEALQAQQAAAQQAAQQAQMAGPAGLGGPTPEAQPGMSQPIPAISAPPQGLTNLTSLLTQLRKGPMANVPNALGVAS